MRLLWLSAGYSTDLMLLPETAKHSGEPNRAHIAWRRQNVQSLHTHTHTHTHTDPQLLPHRLRPEHPATALESEHRKPWRNATNKLIHDGYSDYLAIRFSFLQQEGVSAPHVVTATSIAAMSQTYQLPVAPRPCNSSSQHRWACSGRQVVWVEVNELAAPQVQLCEA